MASRIAARSTMAGTPVKSCRRIRVGRKAVSARARLGGFDRTAFDHALRSVDEGRRTLRFDTFGSAAPPDQAWRAVRSEDP